VFYKTKYAINSIENFYETTGKITIKTNSKKITIPADVLGWIKANQTERHNTYSLHPSKEGLEILDGLRKIQGNK